MKSIRTNAELLLRENYRLSEISEVSFREYVDCESQSDPNFFRWLFDEDIESDFDFDLTKDQEEIFKDFLNYL